MRAAAVTVLVSVSAAWASAQVAVPRGAAATHDVRPGPAVVMTTGQALARIGDYVGKDPTFATYAEIEHYVRTVSAPFGDLTDAQWRHLTTTNVRQRPDGRWGLAYDPGIAIPFKATPAQPPGDLWGVWEAIRCPVLVVRGEESDLLSAATAAEMSARAANATLLEFRGVGHAPMLLDPHQIDPVVRFLRSEA